MPILNFLPFNVKELHNRFPKKVNVFNSRYVVYGGTPGFIILVKDSPFAQTFLGRYES